MYICTDTDIYTKGSDSLASLWPPATGVGATPHR